MTVREALASLTLPDAAAIAQFNTSWAAPWAAEATGPVASSFVDVKENPITKAWIDTFAALGHPLNASPFSGRSTGPYIAPSTVAFSSKTRSSAATAYYQPAVSRTNLEVVTGATVSNIVLEKRRNVQIATGVIYTTGGDTKTLQAKREVILSAGALNSPKILELSGIGDPDVLKAAGVPLLVENKYVGTNLQDHVLCSISFEAIDGFPTCDDLLRGDAEAITIAQQQYAECQSGPFATSGLTDFSYLPTVDFKSDIGALSDILNDPKSAQPSHSLDVARIQHLSDLLVEGVEGTGQYFLFLAQSAAAGEDTTHGVVPNPQAVDLDLHARHVRYIEEIAQTSPLASFLKLNGRRNDPLAFIDGSLDKAKTYVKAASTTNWHSVGTLAMAPREKGGVVDTELRVHGVLGLRVVDASVLPLVPQSNTQSLIYAIAERAAELIKQC